jgi:hypothetical protein
MHLRNFIKEPNLIAIGFLRRFAILIPDKIYVKAYYRLLMGKKINLKNPQTYNEKLQWLKLHDRKPEYTIMVDKFAAKEYVASIIGGDYIIPTLGVWDKFENIEFNQLPDQFVLKTTHDSGGVVVCNDKKSFDIISANKKLSNRLRINAFYILREWPYKNVKPRIIAEKYLENDNGEELLDYKLYCFNGVVKCTLLCSNRDAAKNNLCLDFYNLDWERLPFKFIKYANNERTFPRPRNYDLMIHLAQMLSINIPTIRVDFYEVNGHLFFGELTFTTTSGFSDYEPEEWNYKLGSWINLPAK